MENNYQRNLIGDALTQDQIDEMQKLGGLAWDPRDISIYFDFDTQQFAAEYNDPESLISLVITRGRLQTMAAIGIKTLDNAKCGDLPSIAYLDKIRREKSFCTSKLDIFGAFDSKQVFERIYDYIAEGKTADLSNNEKLFLDLLTMINSFDRQFGRRATVKLLTTYPFNYSYAQAVEYYNEADNLFYTNRGQTKDAIRLKYAEMLDDLAKAALQSASTPKDYEIVSNIVAQAAKVRKLDEIDAQKLPPSAYLRQFRVFSLTPTVLGLPEINRHEVSQEIGNMRIPEADKQRLRRDALIEDANIIETLEYGKSRQN